jgi:hypothetical protein
MYWDYFKYVIKHKWYVAKVCIRKGMFIHAFTHDLSKFLPSEFIPYAKNFFGTKTDLSDREFQMGVLFHYHRNKHHYAYWIGTNGKVFNMPERYAKQLVADWIAMSWVKIESRLGECSFNEAREDTIKYYKVLEEKRLTPMTNYYIHKHLGISEGENETN